jgi:hypothetical protein
MILCYARYGASAVPLQGMGMTSHLYQVTPGHARSDGDHSPDGICTTCKIVTLLRSVGKAYTRDQVGDDIDRGRPRRKVAEIGV